VVNLNLPSLSVFAWLASLPSLEPISGEKRTLARSTAVPLSVTEPLTSTVTGPLFVPPQPGSAARQIAAKAMRHGAGAIFWQESTRDTNE
jgi:hypothetical protein